MKLFVMDFIAVELFMMIMIADNYQKINVYFTVVQVEIIDEFE